MDNFNYYNIFETKGIEYIAIIVFFLILIPFWIILNKKTEIKHSIKKALSFLSFDMLKIPQGIFLGKNHTWIYLEKSGNASVGLDDFLLHTTGELQLINQRNSGEIISKGDLLMEVKQDNKLLKIYSPISGEIMSRNIHLNETPELLNEDPFGKGWIYKIKPTNWVNEIKNCYLAEDAINWSKTELQRFKDFLAISNKKYLSESTLVILQDGGELVDHTLSELSDEVWQDFQEKFLNFKD
ncbi:MAG: glycine cleavage system protein H [Bacteroidetes bacterium]|nr:glycine cleavage system protein H [Bacteroidota bacterium]